MCIDVDVPSKPKCEKCHGTLSPDQEVDLLAGMSLVVYRCINCGRRIKLENEPRPLSGKELGGNICKNSTKSNS